MCMSGHLSDQHVWVRVWVYACVCVWRCGCVTVYVCLHVFVCLNSEYMNKYISGSGGSVVGSVPTVQKVAGSNPTIAAT